MSDLSLTLACWDYDRTRPLIDGRVKPAGVALDVKVLRPRQSFPRMLEKHEFDACELSLGSFATLTARGNCPFVAIPVALSKIFRHSCIYVREGAGIHRPEDLKGRRVGTTQYGATATCFMRGMLQDEYGVRAEDMHWFMGGLTAPTQMPLIPLDLPPAVKLDFLPVGATLEAMFEVGELDALLSIYIPKLFLDSSPSIRRLFPAFKAAETDYYRRTGIFPVMHIVVLREDVHASHPWVAANLYEAFCKARDIAVEGLYDTDALRLALPFLLDHVEETLRVFGKDFWAYGVDANRTTFDALGRYVYEQGLAPRIVKAGDMFLPGFA